MHSQDNGPVYITSCRIWKGKRKVRYKKLEVRYKHSFLLSGEILSISQDLLKEKVCRTCSGTEAERKTIMVHLWDEEGFQQNSEGTKAPPRPQQSRAAPTHNSTCSEKDLLFLYIPTLLVPIKVFQREYSRAARRRI